MSWREQLRPASFRGVPFQVQGHDADGLARRAQTHEYPGRDVPYVEDLGAQTGQFRLEAYVLGEGYFAARDRLIEACQRPGPGELVHPSLGTRTVVCVGCSVRESTRDAGMAVFALSFVQAGENRFPTRGPASRSLVGSAASAARAGARGSFLSGFRVGSIPQWVSSSTIDLIELAASSILGVTVNVPQLVGDISAVQRTLTNLASQAASLVDDPESLVDTLLASVRDVADLSSSPRDGIRVLGGLRTFGEDLDEIAETTENRQKQASQQEAMVRIVRRAAAIETARRSAEVTLDSYEDAVILRDEVLEILDEEIDQAGEVADDDTFVALTALHNAVARDLRDRGAQLARLTTFVPGRTLPALVIAQRLYGDAAREADIVARNRIRHPGFVGGGVPLEIVGA